MNQSVEKITVYGIVPVRKYNDIWQVFIIQHKADHWGFPKGHPDGDHEDPHQTAQRELYEETGLRVASYVFDEPLSVNYSAVSHGKQVDKTATYFVAYVEGNVRLCPDEISDGMWIDIKCVHQKITFDNMQPLLDQLSSLLRNVR